MQISIKRFKDLLPVIPKSNNKVIKIQISKHLFEFKWMLVHRMFHQQNQHDCVCCGAKATHFEIHPVTNPYTPKFKDTENRVSIHLMATRKDGTVVLMTVDHIVPRSRTNDDPHHNDNLQPMCLDCNHSKSNTLPSEEVLGKKKWWNKLPKEMVNLFETEELLSG